MKSFLKKFLKIFIGIAVLILAIISFFFAMRTNDLENANLRKWRAADLDRRTAAVQILVASDENVDLMVQCVDKIATLENSGEMAVRDAVALCHTGIQVNKNN